MSKKFWKVSIWLWVCIIFITVGAVLYIQYDQNKERKAFVASFQYNTDEKSWSANDPHVAYTMNELLSLAESLETSISIDLSTASEQINTGTATQQSFIAFYTSATEYAQKVTNVEITDGALVKQKQYEKIAQQAYTYAQNAAKYYIISAKKIKDSSETIQAQLEQAQIATTTAQKELQTILTMYKN